MTRMTTIEADKQLKRAKAGWKDETEDTESPLQSKIVAWAVAHGYPCHAHPQSRDYIKAHTKGAGWSDVTLCIPGPRVLFLELKAKKGTMRKAQLEMERIMKCLGFEYHRVRTWKRFMEIVNDR